MRQFHKPKDEKRIIAILPRGRYDEWLGADINHRTEFLNSFGNANLNQYKYFDW